MKKILVTGANGFVGKRLVLALLNQGYEVYALCRIGGAKIFTEEKELLHYIWGDLRNENTLNQIPQDIEAAYYLVHSMSTIVQDLEKSEIEVAQQFLKGIQNTKIKQIIYLGGIIDSVQDLSPHLKSRLRVEKILKESKHPVTILRASIIIGAGSASFEIIRDLCEKLPIMVAPKWVKSKCQPIAIADVLFYLTGVLLNEKCMGHTFDIGGPEVLTFEELLLRYSKFRDLKRYILDVPVLTPRLSSYWLVFITSVRFSLCYYLVESMKSDTIVRLNGIQSILPHQCLSYEEALNLAFQKIGQNEVVSSWMDSWGLEDHNPSLEKFVEVPEMGCLKDQRKFLIKGSKEAAIERIWKIGGSEGYYAFNWAWHLRGLIDKLIGGVGLNRGRSHPTNLYPGDALDFWRVILADKQKGHLILYAGMRMPGDAWLEFEIQPEGSDNYLVQTATFRPKGLLGRMYWYVLMPMHFLIFRKMAQAISGY